MRLAEGATPMGRSGTPVKDPVARVTLEFSSPASALYVKPARCGLDKSKIPTLRLTLAFSGPAAPRYGEPERCKLNTHRENQVAAGSAATPC